MGTPSERGGSEGIRVQGEGQLPASLGRPRRAAAQASLDAMRHRIQSGLEIGEASTSQLQEGVCAICLDPLFLQFRPSGKKKGAKPRYRHTVCKRVVELKSCKHSFHNTCLMNAARSASAIARDSGSQQQQNQRSWRCPLCRSVGALLLHHDSLSLPAAH